MVSGYGTQCHSGHLLLDLEARLQTHYQTLVEPHNTPVTALEDFKPMLARRMLDCYHSKYCH